MSRGRQLLGLFVWLASSWACASDPTSSGTEPLVVMDTLGLRFNVSCSSGPCLLTSQNATVTPLSCTAGAGTDAFVLVPDPLLSIYALQIPSSGSLQLNAGEPAHPVACTSDADCLAPGIAMGATIVSYACQQGLCLLQQSCSGGVCNPWGGVLLTYDVLTLCQADLAWPTSCPYITSQPFAGRIAAVANACGANTTCATVPSVCRQLGGPGIDAGAIPGVDGGSS